MASVTEPNSNEQPDRAVRLGCLTAQREQGKVVVLKTDDACSCQLDLSKPNSVAEIQKLAKLLFAITQ